MDSRIGKILKMREPKQEERIADVKSKRLVLNVGYCDVRRFKTNQSIQKLNHKMIDPIAMSTGRHQV